MVNQADLLHGDANGVTSIPPHLASEIADIGEEFLSAEAIMLDYVKAPGDKSVAKFNELREEFQTVVGKLRARVQQ